MVQAHTKTATKMSPAAVSSRVALLPTGRILIGGAMTATSGPTTSATGHQLGPAGVDGLLGELPADEGLSVRASATIRRADEFLNLQLSVCGSSGLPTQVANHGSPAAG